MTRAQVISNVQRDTEHKLDDQLDWIATFTRVLQEFCAAHRFWWRKKRLTFQTAAGTPTYDLATITTVPTGAGVFVEEITFVCRTDGSNVCEVEPVTDDEAIAQYVINSTSDKPAAWMPEGSDMAEFQEIRLSPIPNGIYTITVFFWAMPNPEQDDDDNTIYVVPKFLHHVVQTGLEREAWRLMYGPQDPKFLSADASYKAKVAQAKIKRSIDAGHTPQFKNQDHEAVQSTGHWTIEN